jgi:hypothetical protein
MTDGNIKPGEITDRRIGRFLASDGPDDVRSGLAPRAA